MKSKKTIAIFYSYGVRLLLAEKAKGPYKAETKHSNTVCSKRKRKKNANITKQLIVGLYRAN